MFGNGLELLQPDSIEFDLPYEGLDLVKAYRGEKFTEDELNKAYSGIVNDIRLSLIYYPVINEFNGRKSLQITIQDYQ